MNLDVSTISEQMPEFENHEQARAWFEDQFQERFSLQNIEERDGLNVYSYHLIKQPELYQRYMESFAKPVKHEITNASTFESYATIEITETGDTYFLS
ncbi:hypothetical protein CR194_05705 [Salipaludibacillus keqinensis]|uniref:Uncharacterized protein n=1 Tax=Salipaludibacillus keqinensis TaxID=2045207 RepID=A0A323TKA2_9BACI|nr:hypothetical protein [Salipaludibacillus keqinensis]PYZ95010.1 hypothetical protein CR194_05705 [Salipaludibacillus keqinensis]